MEKDAITQNLNKNEYSISIKGLRDWAKNNLANQSIYHDVFGKNIEFTVKGIKEYLNQPHKHYFEKNQMIKNIKKVLKRSEYKGFTKYNGRISHIFEIKIKDDASWLIANEYQGRGIIFYSISDSEKVLTGIKKQPIYRLSELQSDAT